jgi:N-acetylmuramoyl-L-alanine amidase
MQIWRYILAGSVVTALAFIPQSQITRKAAMPALDANPSFASLKLQKLTPTNVLPARSPVSFFSSKQNKPLSGVTICVDPGHGGENSDPGYTGGTRGVVTGQTEGDVNLRVSLILRQYLQAAGATVVMTRISDDRCQGGTCKRDELDFRPNTAKQYKADFFVSVHHNEASNSSANYTVVFHPKGSGASVPLAENISSAVSRYLGTRNVGAKSGDYRVLNMLGNIPGVIVEASFMSNPTEDQRLANLSYNKMEAKAIATGVLNYFRTAKGRDVNFQEIFSPIDNQAHTAQAMADAAIVRRQLVERKSMFNRTYEEVTVDRSGKQIARRQLGSSTLAAKKQSTAKSSSKVASAKPSSKVTNFVAASQKNAKSLQTANSSRRVVLTEREKAIGESRPII